MNSHNQSGGDTGAGGWSRRRFVRCAGWAMGLAGWVRAMLPVAASVPQAEAVGSDAVFAGGLPQPQAAQGSPLMEVLSRRASQRAFSDRPLSSQMLSDLLWAAFGVNRPGSGQRTAPSAMDNREIDILVALPQGVFLFDAETHGLIPHLKQDVRPLTGGQEYVRVAPVSLVYVADDRRQQRVPERDRVFYAAADTGFISQNVYLFCAAEGLATVVHVVSDQARLAETLKLDAQQRIVLAQCVGHPAGGGGSSAAS